VSTAAKILIADRNRHVRELLRRELGQEGYRVEVARDGRELLERLAGPEPPDLLILDLEVPYLDEVALWERLKGREPAIPVLIHTFGPEDRTPGPGAPVVLFLEKRGDTDHLKAAVMDAITGRACRGLAPAP
jgi:CheY-like chemotaxis protein